MADDARTIQGIDWRRTFPFTHIFRSFRIAIHPSKLLLALIGLILLYGAGRAMDGMTQQKYRAAYEDRGLVWVDEIEVYERTYTNVDYDNIVKELEKKRGLFITFFNYELAQIDAIVKGVRDGRWVGGPRADSVIGAVRNFVIAGPAWAFSKHPIYFTIFGVIFLFIWSIFGGAIARIAAVHVARDEKISIRQALRFSMGKLLSFLFAPVIPMLIVVVIGLGLALVALIGNIPYVGPIVIGAFFFLALAAGFVMTLVLIGTIGGFNLMYPTIAVEGSDSFDAISRSFSYLYARPWRMAFYTLVALVYGALCYLFVRLFIWLMLALTHYFVDLGMFADADNARELFDQMWTSPVAAGRLIYSPNWDALNWGEKTGAFFIMVWVYLVISMLGAFAISFYFSVNTVIYYLMRQEVDAAELDDVYVEQSDEDFSDTAAPSTTGTGTTTATVTTTVVEAVVTPPQPSPGAGDASPPSGGTSEDRTTT